MGLSGLSGLSGLGITSPSLDAYGALVLSNNPSSLVSYLPLTESFGASVAIDSSGNGRSGTHKKDTAGVAGPVSYATFFDGHNSSLNWYSAGLAGAFNGNAGTLAICGRVVDNKLWTNGTARRLVMLYANDNNNIYLQLHGSGGLYLFGQAIFGGTNKAAFFGNGSSPAGNWFHTAVTWDKATDEVKYYLNGIQAGSTQTGLGTWSGSLASDRVLIGGSQALDPPFSIPNAWHGFFANAELRNVAMPQSYFAAQYALMSQSALPAYKHMVVIGDSIALGQNATNYYGWTYLLRDLRRANYSNLVLLDNAATGGAKSADGITFAARQVASLGSADIALVAVGMNDYTNSIALATYESNLNTIVDSLQTICSKVYLLNITPTTASFTPAWSEYNTSVQTVATAQGISVIGVSNAYPTGILPDGTHPLDDGHAIISGIVNSAL